jgi:hypothetical protein
MKDPKHKTSCKKVMLFMLQLEIQYTVSKLLSLSYKTQLLQL